MHPSAATRGPTTASPSSPTASTPLPTTTRWKRCRAPPCWKCASKPGEPTRFGCTPRPCATRAWGTSPTEPIRCSPTNSACAVSGCTRCACRWHTRRAATCWRSPAPIRPTSTPPCSACGPALSEACHRDTPCHLPLGDRSTGHRRRRPRMWPMTSGVSQDFVHLHVHTEYSMLDGASKVDDLLGETARIGQRALAITDHGYLFGAFDFWSAAQRHGVKPIIGLEAYVTPGTSRFDRTRVRWGEEHQARDDVSARGAYTHMTLLARNNTGINNLFRLGSRASLEGQWGKWPRMDRELLTTYADGLIATTGCPSGEVQTRLRLGQYDEAVRAAAEFQDIFGKENYYVEVMDHGLDIERRVIADLLRLSRDIGAPLLATNDSHYTRPEDRVTHEVMLALQSGAKLTDPTYDEGGNRFAFSGDTYYLRPAQEMRELWRDHAEACDNTLLVAEQCEVSFRTA